MRRVLQIGGLGVLVTFVVVLAIAVRRAQDKGSYGKAVLAGALPPGPAFDLPALDGKGRIRFADYRGRVLVLNVWASWCTSCEDEEPLLRQIALDQAGPGVAFLGLDYVDVREGAIAFARRFSIPFRSAIDDRTVSGSLGVSGAPETFVFDTHGRGVAYWPGPFDPDELRTAIKRAATT